MDANKTALNLKYESCKTCH